jgi:hypothetical protein
VPTDKIISMLCAKVLLRSAKKKEKKIGNQKNVSNFAA